MKKLTKAFLLFGLVSAMSSYTIMPVAAATKAEFGSNKCCVVNINESLINKKGKQYATVKLNTHSLHSSKNSKGTVIVRMYDQYGNHIWSGQKKGGDTLKLGDDHSVYKIYVSAYNKPVEQSIWSQTFAGGDNFVNQGKCVTWSITQNKNCSIY